MSDGRQLRKRRPQSAPVGPVGELIADATRRLSYSLRDAAKAINEAAKDVDGVAATFGPSTVHKWIHGVIPQPEARRWIAAGLDIPLERLSEAAEAQQDRQRKSAPVGSAPTLPDFDSDDVITIPIPMANGGIAYVITRRQSWRV